MKIGFSTMNTPLDPTPMELAKALEDRGFESLWTGEHSHIPTSRLTPWPAGEQLPEPYKLISDPYVSLMAAATVTAKLKVCTGIALLNQRDIFVQAAPGRLEAQGKHSVGVPGTRFVQRGTAHDGQRPTDQRRPQLEITPSEGHRMFTDRPLSDVLPETQLVLPSIGSERKTHFPSCHGFFDPGVCSRSGWTVSS